MAGDEWVDPSPLAKIKEPRDTRTLSVGADRMGLVAATVGAIVQAAVTFALDFMKASSEIKLAALILTLIIAIFIFVEMHSRKKISKSVCYAFVGFSITIFGIFGFYPFYQQRSSTPIAKPTFSILAKLYFDDNQTNRFEKGERIAGGVTLTTLDMTGVLRPYVTNSEGEAEMTVTQTGMLTVSVCGVSHTVEVRQQEGIASAQIDMIGIQPSANKACEFKDRLQ